jgi:hypothetical protein
MKSQGFRKKVLEHTPLTDEEFNPMKCKDLETIRKVIAWRIAIPDRSGDLSHKGFALQFRKGSS